MSETSTPTPDGTNVTNEAGPSEEPILELDDLTKYFSQADGFLDRLVGEQAYVRAVDGVNLVCRPGETLAVVGESGCGKSTLGRTMLKIDEPTDGRIRYRSEDITDLSGSDLRPYRREMQIIFQDPLAALNPRQTVGEILTAPMEVHDIGDSDDERLERARDLLERVGLEANHTDRYPHQFSGGQQQRIGIARALTLNPSFIVADEPTSALDVSVQAQILNLLEELQEELELSILFITHDLSVVRHIADRVAVMYLGEFVEQAPVEQLFEDPQHPYTRSLLSSVPRIDPQSRTDRILLEGSVPSPIDPPSGCRFHTRCPVVIPPEDWTGSDEEFKTCFTFRNHVLSGELDPEASRARLAADSGKVSDFDVAQYFIETSFPGDVEALPDEATNAITEAAQMIAEINQEVASTIVRNAFPSPCVESKPRDADTGPDSYSRCHRVDPEAPGDRNVW